MSDRSETDYDALWEPWYMAYPASAILFLFGYVILYLMGCMMVFIDINTVHWFDSMIWPVARVFTIAGILFGDIWALCDYV